MKRLIVLVVFNVLAGLQIVNAQNTQPQQQQQSENGVQYSSRWNNLNVDTILSSRRLVMNYVECLLNRKPCPPEGKDLKRILPEALRSKCARCTNYQREGALKVISKLYFDYPEQYALLRSRWDPTGEYNRQFEEYLRGLQFNVISNEQGGYQPQAPITPSTQSPQKIPPPTVPSSTTSQVALNPDTQRPARNPGLDVANRFGGADESDLDGSPAIATHVTSTVRTPMATATVSTPMAMPSPTASRASTSRGHRKTTRHPTVQPAIVIDKYYISQSSPEYQRPVNPLVGLINTIGFKITNTADFFAGMLRGTLQIEQYYRDF